MILKDDKIKSEVKVQSLNEYTLNLDIANKEQKEFYDYWLSQIEKGNIIDVEGHLEYIFVYLHSIIIGFIENEDINFLLDQFKVIMNGYGNYPIIKESLIRWESDAYFFVGNYNESLKIKEKIGFKIYDIIDYGLLKSGNFINGDILVSNKYNWLTNFGLENKKAISEIINVYLDNFDRKYGKNIVRFFFEDFDIERDEDLEKLKEFFIYKEEFKKLKSFIPSFKYNQHSDIIRIARYLKYFSDKDNLRLKQNLSPELYSEIKDREQKYHSRSLNEENIHYKRVLFNDIFSGIPKIFRITKYNYREANIIFKALENELKRIIRESENVYRKERNIPMVGEGWINETDLYYKIKEEFANEKVISHGMPQWLGKQHLDIYLPEKNIGIEYQGDQHQEPVDFFGGKEGFENRIKLDNKKKELCQKNNCKLIYVYPNYDWNEVKIRISKILAEIDECRIDNDLMQLKIAYADYSYKYNKLNASLTPILMKIFDDEYNVNSLGDDYSLEKENSHFQVLFCNDKIEINDNYLEKFRIALINNEKMRIFHAGLKLNETPLKIQNFEIYNQMNTKLAKPLIDNFNEQKCHDTLINELYTIFDLLAKDNKDKPIHKFFSSLCEKFVEDKILK